MMSHRVIIADRELKTCCSGDDGLYRRSAGGRVDGHNLERKTGALVAGERSSKNL